MCDETRKKNDEPLERPVLLTLHCNGKWSCMWAFLLEYSVFSICILVIFYKVIAAAAQQCLQSTFGHRAVSLLTCLCQNYRESSENMNFECEFCPNSSSEGSATELSTTSTLKISFEIEIRHLPTNRINLILQMNTHTFRERIQHSTNGSAAAAAHWARHYIFIGNTVTVQISQNSKFNTCACICVHSSVCALCFHWFSWRE